jgi:LmbE family N-acetylglucosaminyl deacetylase
VKPLRVGQIRRLLFLGAHCDDIEIGCGGSILSWVAQTQDLSITWVVFSSSAERRAEALRSADAFLAGAKEKRVLVRDFRDGFFPYVGGSIKESFEELKRECDPDLIFTHHRHDLHQDHRLVSELTWNTFRDHMILEYEIPKYDGDLGSPNVFVPLAEAICLQKIDRLLSLFPSQVGKHWFSRELFMAILRLRGMEGNIESGYAEAFYCRKAVLGWDAPVEVIAGG